MRRGGEKYLGLGLGRLLAGRVAYHGELAVLLDARLIQAILQRWMRRSIENEVSRKEENPPELEDKKKMVTEVKLAPSSSFPSSPVLDTRPPPG